MKEIIITATAESIEQAKALLEVGVDRIYVGESQFGLRLPKTFTHDELKELARLAHERKKAITVAVNALMHQEMMDQLKPYLDFLEEIKADYVTVGDTGVFYILDRDGYTLKPIYDTSVMATSSRQLNFWHQHGAVEAVLAREIPAAELFDIAKNLELPAEILVYGASVIHHSKRPLLQNYYRFTGIEDKIDKDRGLFLSEPNKPETHYSIYEDNHGTHIFINNDITMMTKLSELYSHGFVNWKLDGVYCSGKDFVAIAALFIQAKEALLAGTFSQEKALILNEELQKHHPKGRGLDTGFYELDPDLVK